MSTTNVYDAINDVTNKVIVNTMEEERKTAQILIDNAIGKEKEGANVLINRTESLLEKIPGDKNGEIKSGIIAVEQMIIDQVIQEETKLVEEAIEYMIDKEKTFIEKDIKETLIPIVEKETASFIQRLFQCQCKCQLFSCFSRKKE